MTKNTNNNRERARWSGQFVFILAAAGSAIGLGNLWKFPYVAWQNGAGLFILIYFICVVLVGLPVMISEITIGKLSKKDSFGAFRDLDQKKSPFRFFGILGIISSFVLLSYYAVISGWSLEYQIKSLNNKFAKVDIPDIHKILLENVNLKKPVSEAISNTTNNKNNESKAYTLKIYLNEINQIILASEKKGAAQKIKIKAFKESIDQSFNNTDNNNSKINFKIKQKLLKDINILSQSQTNRDAQEINTLFEEHKSNIVSTLQSAKNNKAFKKWCNYFYKQKIKQPDFQDWLQISFLPHYSSFYFGKFINNPFKVMTWHFIVMVILCLISMGGIRNGVERISKYGMIILFIILGGLMINSLSIDKENKGLEFLIFGQPDKFSLHSIAEALGHSFFTLSIGLGVMVTYGSYLNKKSPPVKDAFIISGLDTLISLVACVIIFPIIFVQGMDPVGGGIGILFTTLPLEFFKFQGGAYVSFIFYVLIFIAAITSAISLLEVVVTFLQDEFKMNRLSASILSSAAIYLAGIPSALSLGFLDVADIIISNFFLPLGGFIIAIFIGYKMNMETVKQEFLTTGSSLRTFYLFRFSIRYISPCLVAIVLGVLIYDKFFA